MYDYLLLIIATLLQTGTFSISKSYQKECGSSLKSGLKFSVIGSIFSAIIFFAIINRGQFEISAFSLIMAVLSALLITAYTLLGFKIMEGGQLTLYTFFLMTGGMLVPYVWGLLFLDESFSILRTIGLILIIVSIFITEASNQKTNKKQLLLCVAVFFLNGFVSVVSKMHQINPAAVSASGFIVLSSLAKLIIFTPILAVLHGKKQENTKKHILPKKIILLVAISAALEKKACPKGKLSYNQTKKGHTV